MLQFWESQVLQNLLEYVCKSVRTSGCMESGKSWYWLIYLETGVVSLHSKSLWKDAVKKEYLQRVKTAFYLLFHPLILCQAHPFSGCLLLGAHHSSVLCGIQIPLADLFPLCMHQLGEKRESVIKWRKLLDYIIPNNHTMHCH